MSNKKKMWKKYGYFDKVLEDSIGAYLWKKKNKIKVVWRNW